MRAVVIGLVVLALTGASAQASRLPGAPGCPIFPRDNPWNQRVDSLPVAANSTQLVASIGLSAAVHPDFGSVWQGRPIGIPFDVVSRSTPRSHVRFDYADESDRVGYPIPSGVHIEGGSDGHALLIDRSSCRLFELYDLRRVAGAWHAGSGATWSLRSDRLRPAGWTSADAAGLPILPGLARWDEARRGAIDHALRFTAPRTRHAYVYPARHFASESRAASLPPMGLRVRLKASVDISSYPPQARVVLTALKAYGMILADNGSPWYVSGAPDPHWSNEQLHTLAQLHGSDFEVVDTSSLPRH